MNKKTAPGIYCEGKISGKPVPYMPDSFSFIIQGNFCSICIGN